MMRPSVRFRASPSVADLDPPQRGGSPGSRGSPRPAGGDPTPDVRGRGLGVRGSLGRQGVHRADGACPDDNPVPARVGERTLRCSEWIAHLPSSWFGLSSADFTSAAGRASLQPTESASKNFSALSNLRSLCAGREASRNRTRSPLVHYGSAYVSHSCTEVAINACRPRAGRQKTDPLSPRRSQRGPPPNDLEDHRKGAGE